MNDDVKALSDFYEAVIDWLRGEREYEILAPGRTDAELDWLRKRITSSREAISELYSRFGLRSDELQNRVFEFQQRVECRDLEACREIWPQLIVDIVDDGGGEVPDSNGKAPSDYEILSNVLYNKVKAAIEDEGVRGTYERVYDHLHVIYSTDDGPAEHGFPSDHKLAPSLAAFQKAVCRGKDITEVDDERLKRLMDRFDLLESGP